MAGREAGAVRLWSLMTVVARHGHTPPWQTLSSAHVHSRSNRILGADHNSAWYWTIDTNSTSP